MSPLKKLVLLILFISFMVFVAFFGRIPALRRTPIAALHSNMMLHERHWTVVIFFMLIMVVGEYMFIPQAWPKIESFTKLIVVVTVFLPYLFLYLACAADPGYITPENHAYYMSLYPYDHTLFHPGHMCRTCKFLKPARSKHCSLCKRCVAKADHHCVFINSCVGYGNQHWFILLLISTAFLCTYGGFLGLSIIKVRVQRYTPGWSVWKPRGMTVSQYLAGWGWGIQDNVNMGASSLLAALTSPLVWGLLLYTLYLVYCGTTTNETLKWSDWKEDMRDGFAFRRSMPANRQKNERVEPRFTRWPVEVQQVIVTTQDGQPPKDELRYPGEGEWERVWNLSDVENLYDMGLWDNLVDIFVRNDDYAVIGFIQPPQVRRLQMLGALSLLAIVIGGSAIIFVGTNALLGRKEKDELGRARPPGQARFSVGHEWSIQTWIAIVGVAFALLSYGFT
ncbi:SWF1 spore Wall Formation [Fusarium subglutinans]|uniref:Palmitoyltransferase n=1 Tax=Gibberella subglutinans TaxID=42677 RepID=A0A8H5V343_GIBSU|nr:SWF1 spore Wall Formation [Fusarium subglutinans]KAF5608806.1 SWF1 spore Wall Formation [Fusarium subglutinans]